MKYVNESIFNKSTSQQAFLGGGGGGYNELIV